MQGEWLDKNNTDAVVAHLPCSQTQYCQHVAYPLPSPDSTLTPCGLPLPQLPLNAHTSGLCFLNTSCRMGSCGFSSCLLCWLELQDHGLQCFLHHLELPLERLWMLLRSTQRGGPHRARESKPGFREQENSSN